MNSQVPGMVVSGKYAVMIDRQNGHYGWLFQLHLDGSWISLRKALPGEMAAAELQKKIEQWLPYA